MSITDIPDISTQQEKLLQKSKTNLCLTEYGAKLHLGINFLYNLYNIPALKYLADCMENGQFSIEGYTRQQFLDAIKHMPPDAKDNLNKPNTIT